MCCELWIHRWGSHSHGCSLGNMDNKQIKKKIISHCHKCAKEKQNNERQGSVGLEGGELWASQEMSFWRSNSGGETRRAGASYEGHHLPSNVTFNLYVHESRMLVFPTWAHLPEGKDCVQMVSPSQPEQDRAEHWVMFCIERTNKDGLNVCAPE